MGGVIGPSGVREIVLPHYQFDELTELLAWRNPGSTRDEKPFERVIQLTRDYFDAKPVDFAEIACDLPGEKTFGGIVLRACRKIPYGQRSTYGHLAEQIARPEAARAVAAALGKNPIPLIVPCHRVTYSGGGLGGFSAPGGEALKQRMLAIESRDRLK
jgi:methylated-DNA-[protein]-cysteine S-methyltransferase